MKSLLGTVRLMLCVATYVVVAFTAGYLGSRSDPVWYVIALAMVLLWTTVLWWTTVHSVVADPRLAWVIFVVTWSFSSAGLLLAYFAGTLATLDDDSMQRPFLFTDSQVAFWSSPLTATPLVVTVGLLLVVATLVERKPFGRSGGR